MKSLLWIGLGLLGLVGSSLSAQTDKDLQKAFEKSVMKQQLYLRNLSADEPVTAHWDGSRIVFDEPRGRMLGPIRVDSVQFNSKRIELTGVRYILAQDGAGRRAVELNSQVEVDVALGGFDRNVVLSVLRDGLFFASAADALASVPIELGGGKATDAALYGAATAGALGQCDCNDRGAAICEGRKPTVGIKPPVLVNAPEPEFSEEARGQKFNGSVLITFVVDAGGNPVDLWVKKPMGLGLDAKALASVRSYRFKPATCHDRPIKSRFFVNVKFESY